LTNKSLWRQEPESGMLRQHDTTRYYAAEKLRAAGAENEFAHRHAGYYLSFAQIAAARFGTTSGRAWLADVRAVLDNVRAALQWSIDGKRDVSRGVGLTASFCDAWMALGLDFECKERIDTALSVCDEGTPLALRARLLLARAQIGIRSQRSAITPAQEAVALYRSTDDERGLATALNVLGYALSREDSHAEADRNFEEALAIATRIDSVRQRGLALLNLGVNRETANDFKRTRELYEAALALGIARGDDYIVGAAYLDLSVLCEITEAPEEGFAYARRAFEAFDRGGETNGCALALGNLTTNLIGLGRMEEARVAARDYVIHARAYRLDTIFIIALEKVAAIAQSAGDFVASGKLLGFTAAHAAALGLKRDPGNVRFTDGVLRALHEKLGADVALAISEGATLSEAAAADLALSVVSSGEEDRCATPKVLTP
jgi:tetratricopeptide (TPR) repeat protein